MGWTAYYQVVRETPLTQAEIASLAELVRKQRQAPWDAEPFHIAIARGARADRVIAAGWNKLAMSEDSGDVELLENALAELAKLVGGELRVRDDFGAITRGPKLVEMEYRDLSDPTQLVAAAPVTVRGDGVVPLLDAVMACEDNAQQDQLHASLAQLEAHDVAVAIYERYRVLCRNYQINRALSDALRRLDDPTSVAHEFLAAWRNPEGTYFYGDMPMYEHFVIGLARVPEVIAQWTADLSATGTELECRRAEVAIRSLATAGIVRPLLELIRSKRGARRTHDEEFRVYSPAHRFLAERRDPRAIPTLLHFVATARRRGWHTAALDAVVEMAPDRARPFAVELARRGVFRRNAIEWMRTLGEPGLADSLAARSNLPIEQRAIDIDIETRHAALKEIADRKDPSTFLSLVFAESLDKYLRARSDDPGLPFTWHDWKGVVEGDAINGTTAKKLQWYEFVGKHRLAPQVIWPEVAEIQTAGAGKVCERYPSEFLEVPAEQLAALEAEEAAIIAAS